MGYKEVQLKEKDMNKLIKEFAERKVKELSLIDPAWKDMNVFPSVAVRKKKPAGSSKIRPDLFRLMVREFMNPQCYKVVQAELTRKVRDMHPNHTIHASIWNQPLQPYEKNKMTSLMHGHLVPDDYVNLTSCKTLSDMRRTFEAKREKGSYPFKVNFIIGDNALTVDKKRYSYEMRGKGDERYGIIRVLAEGKRRTLRMDALLAMLGKL
jgi:hypothetical protein